MPRPDATSQCPRKNRCPTKVHAGRDDHHGHPIAHGDAEINQAGTATAASTALPDATVRPVGGQVMCIPPGAQESQTRASGQPSTSQPKVNHPVRASSQMRTFQEEHEQDRPVGNYRFTNINSSTHKEMPQQ